ncbi:ATP-binding protein [Ensifer sp. ENS12]|uniref:PAS domain-containing sensor histidine kinase n=1 Tax=Ensifer sp. ENS12 TaxID=2854774 RepID=UPI002107C42D|nr:ATP-binding protein [Ensifer sp. ENS12]
MTMRGVQNAMPHDIAHTVAAAALGAAVFYIDAFTQIESAIAVLYVIVLLLSAGLLSRNGMIFVGVACNILTLVSYTVSHGFVFDISSLLRLTVSLSAISVTCALILRNAAARAALIASNKALRDSERRYRSIFEQSRVALWERDYSSVRSYLMSIKREGVVDFRAHALSNPDVVEKCARLIRTIAANDAAIELLGHTATKGSPVATTGHVLADRETTINLLEAIFSERKGLEQTGTLVRHDAEIRQVIISLQFPEDTAAFERVVVGMVDITQREMTQKALLEAQAELAKAARAATVGALSASLAHELNQPLAALTVNTQTLLKWLSRAPPDLVAVRRSAERMVRDGQRASDIIENTRRLLRQERRMPEVLDLVSLVDETCALMKPDLLRSKVEIRVEPERDLPAVNAVRIELQQVLVNLIANAIQAMESMDDPRKMIRICLARASKSSVKLFVRDSGPGISPAMMGKLFAAFQSTKPYGLGIGLSICVSMVEANGGTLKADNAVGGGAVFEITLPV